MDVIKLIILIFFIILLINSSLNFFYRKKEIKNFFFTLVPTYLLVYMFNYFDGSLNLINMNMIFISCSIIFFVLLTNLYRSVTLEILIYISKNNKISKKKVLKEFDVKNFIINRINNINASGIYTRKNGLNLQGKILLTLYKISKKIYNR
jgi:hypothetical protein